MINKIQWIAFLTNKKAAEAVEIAGSATAEFKHLLYITLIIIIHIIPAFRHAIFTYDGIVTP